MSKYTIRQTVMISKKQAESLMVLKGYNINVSNFIRIAIREKIKKDWKSIKEPKETCPFSHKSKRLN